jgi:hypothetical protein
VGGRMQSRRADGQRQHSNRSEHGAHMIVVHDGDRPR